MKRTTRHDEVTGAMGHVARDRRSGTATPEEARRRLKRHDEDDEDDA